VRVNGEALSPRKAEPATTEYYNVAEVDIISLDVIQAMRYVPLESGNPKQSFLYIPIGESISPRPVATC
jgi:hypothetical protein